MTSEWQPYCDGPADARWRDMERDCRAYELADIEPDTMEVDMDAYEQQQADRQMAERLIPRPGHVVAMTKIPACDICGRPATWDAPTWGGPWAYLCDKDEAQFHTRPGQTGVGIGQRLVLREEK